MERAGPQAILRSTLCGALNVACERLLALTWCLALAVPRPLPAVCHHAPADRLVPEPHSRVPDEAELQPGLQQGCRQCREHPLAQPCGSALTTAAGAFTLALTITLAFASYSTQSQPQAKPNCPA
jgi:hypothetical protein